MNPSSSSAVPKIHTSDYTIRVNVQSYNVFHKRGLSIILEYDSLVRKNTSDFLNTKISYPAIRW